MIDKPRVALSSHSNNSIPIVIRWYSDGMPRPSLGLEGIMYVNMNGKSFSFWKDSLGKYVDFILSKNTNVTTNNKKSDKDANESTSKELNDSLTFSFDNNILTIYDSNGTIHEIPIPDVKPLEDKIKELEGRIRKLEDALL